MNSSKTDLQGIGLASISCCSSPPYWKHQEGNWGFSWAGADDLVSMVRRPWDPCLTVWGVGHSGSLLPLSLWWSTSRLRLFAAAGDFPGSSSLNGLSSPKPFPCYLIQGGCNAIQCLSVRGTCWSSYSMQQDHLEAPCDHLCKFVPLSLNMCSGGPRRLLNWRNAWVKESISSEKATSRWTALLDMHVNIHPYLFSWLRPCLTRNGPK